MNSLAFDTFFPWLILAGQAGGRFGPGRQAGVYRAVAGKEFRRFHAKRMPRRHHDHEEIWKAENADMLEKLEREFPAEELTEE